MRRFLWSVPRSRALRRCHNPECTCKHPTPTACTTRRCGIRNLDSVHAFVLLPHRLVGHPLGTAAPGVQQRSLLNRLRMRYWGMLIHLATASVGVAFPAYKSIVRSVACGSVIFSLHTSTPSMSEATSDFDKHSFCNFNGFAWLLMCLPTRLVGKSARSLCHARVHAPTYVAARSLRTRCLFNIVYNPW